MPGAADGRAVRASPRVTQAPGAVRLRPDAIALLAMLCGAAIAIRLELVGEVYLVELLLPVLATFCILARGMGSAFHGGTFALFLCAGVATFAGYLVSDLAAANSDWQYLRGWGRVILLLSNVVSMLLLVAQSPRNLWWFMFGLGGGGVAWLAANGVPLTTWKIGYGEYVAFLVAALAAVLPRHVGTLALAACGVISLLLDYRSLGATCVLAAALVVVSHRSQRSGGVGRLFGLGVMLTMALALMLSLLASTQETFEERRQLSNGGRYVGIVVAARAIAQSPLLGYGSWAEEGEFAQMLRSEAARLEREIGRPVELGRSLLPHSQLLQAWVEGGLLGATFFLIYGALLLWALRWFVMQRPADGFTAAGIFALLYGLWNFIASPFLGFTRIYIAMAVGVIAIARVERERVQARLRAAPAASLTATAGMVGRRPIVR